MRIQGFKDFGVMLKLLPDFSIQMRNIIFGYFDSDRTKENFCFIIHFILLLKIFLSRFYIHKCKFSHCKPVFMVFLRDMENYINLISISNNKKAMKTVGICSAFKVLVSGILCETMALYYICYYILFILNGYFPFLHF